MCFLGRKPAFYNDRRVGSGTRLRGRHRQLLRHPAFPAPVMPAPARPHKGKNLNPNPVAPHSLANHHNHLPLQSAAQVHHLDVPVDEPQQKEGMIVIQILPLIIKLLCFAAKSKRARLRRSNTRTRR